MPLLAALLAIPTGTRYPPLDLAPEMLARTILYLAVVMFSVSLLLEHPMPLAIAP